MSKTLCEGTEEGEVVEGNAARKTRAKCTVRQRDGKRKREREDEREGVATGLQNEHSVIPKNFADIKFHLISFRFSQSPNFYLNKISCKFLSNSQKSQHGILNTYVQTKTAGFICLCAHFMHM